MTAIAKNKYSGKDWKFAKQKSNTELQSRIRSFNKLFKNMTILLEVV